MQSISASSELQYICSCNKGPTGGVRYVCYLPACVRLSGSVSDRLKARGPRGPRDRRGALLSCFKEFLKTLYSPTVSFESVFGKLERIVSHREFRFLYVSFFVCVCVCWAQGNRVPA